MIGVSGLGSRVSSEFGSGACFISPYNTSSEVGTHHIILRSKNLHSHQTRPETRDPRPGAQIPATPR